MQHPTGTDPDHDLERTGDEFEERIEHLDEQIADARHEAEVRAEEHDPFEDVAGDWEDTDDEAGGEDPEAFDDPELDDDEDDDDY